MARLLGSIVILTLLTPVSIWAQTVTCESIDRRAKECAIDTRGNVRIIRELSSVKCVQGMNWGVTQGAVWVNDGCRAVFQSTGGSQSGNSGTIQPSGLPTQVTCESLKNMTKECAIDTRGNVRLIRQLSDTKCSEGVNWGINRNTVWVDDGCRASFQADLPASGGPGSNQPDFLPTRVTCQSEGNRIKQCPINTRGGVRLVRQIGFVQCAEGKNWKVSRNSVVVNDGCRAEFQSIGGYWGSGAGNRPSESLPTRATCESINGAPKECALDTRGTVRVVQQLSKTRCQQGVNWGLNKNSVWVNGGCRAVFELQVSGSSGGSGKPSQRLVKACNAERNLSGEVVNYEPLTQGAWEIVLKYNDGEYVCDVQPDGRVTYFEKLRLLY